MSERGSRKFLCIFFGVFGIVLFLIVGINAVVDPFFNYRIPENSDYYEFDQNYAPTWKTGMSRHLYGYDSIWVGSSLSSHISVDYLNEQLGVDCCTGIISAGRPNIYRMFIENAMKTNDIRYVFYELEVQHWGWDTLGTHYDLSVIPEYIKTDAVVDDVEYLLGKTTLIQSMKTLINAINAVRISGESDGGTDREGESASRENEIMPENTVYSVESMAPTVYSNNYNVFQPSWLEAYTKNSLVNIEENIAPFIEANPNVKFIFVCPPISALLYASLDESDLLDDYLDNVRAIYLNLLSYNNVEIHAINLVEDYTSNLDNYMDSGHYEPLGGTLVVDSIKKGICRVTKENIESIIHQYQGIADRFEWPFLKLNFVGEDVKVLQSQLVAMGYEVDEEGFYGSMTENAVKDIQIKNGLEVTGIVFQETQDVIDEILNH